MTDKQKTLKIVVFSSLAQDTGCFLRAHYLSKSLGRFAEVTFIKPMRKSLPFRLDTILSIPANLVRALFSRADIYIGIKPFPNVTIPLMAKKLLCGKPVVLDIDDLEGGYRKGAALAVARLMQIPFLKHADLVTCHNELLAHYISKTFDVDNNRLHRLEQGVDLDVFACKTSDFKLRARFPKEKKIVLYAGHLNIASDLDSVMDAMKIVQAKLPCTFIVAGGGPLENCFRRYAKNIGLEVFFTGHITNRAVAAYISIADVCLVYHRNIPANNYRCSMKLREYLAMGKRVVTAGAGELADFDEYTCHCEADVTSFAKCIIETLQTEPDGREKAAIEHMKRSFDWNKIGKRFMARLQAMT